MRGFGRRVFSYSQYQSAVGGRHNLKNLMRLQSLAHGGPRGVDALVEKSLLNGNQQMVGQHTKKDVRFHSPFLVMKDRPLAQRRLERSKRRLSPRQQNVNSPSLFGAQISAICLEQIAAVQFFLTSPLVLIQAVAEGLCLGIVLHAVNTALHANNAP